MIRAIEFLLSRARGRGGYRLVAKGWIGQIVHIDIKRARRCKVYHPELEAASAPSERGAFASFNLLSVKNGNGFFTEILAIQAARDAAIKFANDLRERSSRLGMNSRLPPKRVTNVACLLRGQAAELPRMRLVSGALGPRKKRWSGYSRQRRTGDGIDGGG